MGYTSTFIAVAEDCRAATGEVPPARAGAPTVAGLQYAMLTSEPGRWQQEDVLFACCPAVRSRDDRPEQEMARLREEYFAQPRACLRASPLPKTYGWGLHYDSHGRITLHPVGSPEYVRLSQDSSLTQLRAMRSSRARTHTARLSVDALNLGHTEPNAEERHDHPH